MKSLSESHRKFDSPGYCVCLAAGLWLVAFASTGLAELPPIPAALAATLPSEEAVLAEVNGQPVSGKEVRVRMLTAPQTEQQHPRKLHDYVQEAVDRRLIEQFLKRRKVVPTADVVDARMRVFQQRAGDEGALERMGLDEELLRRQVTLSMAWQQHVQGTLTDAQFRDYFKGHRAELDGTKLHIQQVFRPLSPESTADERAAAMTELKQLRERLVGGTETFEAASGTEGDLGWQTALGNAPPQVLTAAFRLSDMEVSEVVESAGGLHLVRVVERIPGQLSLEDVRTEVLSALSAQLWDEEVERQRKSARIQLSLP